MEQAIADLLRPILETYPVLGVVGVVGWFFRGLLIRFLDQQKAIIEWQQKIIDNLCGDERKP